MTGSVEVIDLTSDGEHERHPGHPDDASRNQPAVLIRKRGEAYDFRKDHRDFWQRVESGPKQHSIKRMRNIGTPRLRDVCPFLELPAEVRNRIYGYALGGHNLHMFARTIEERPHWPVSLYHCDLVEQGSSEVYQRGLYFIQYMLCKCPENDLQTYRKGIEEPEQTKDGIIMSSMGKPGFKMDFYDQRYDSCLDFRQWKYRVAPFRERPARLNMALLRTCKQVYNEACLVPYYDNVFSCISGRDLDVFFTCVLQQKQREVLQHVQYTKRWRSPYESCDDHRFRFANSAVLSGLRQSTADRLFGLKTLDVTLNLPRERSLREVEFRQTETRMPRFLSPSLKVRVAVSIVEHWHIVDFGRVRSAASELEYALAKPAKEVQVLP